MNASALKSLALLLEQVADALQLPAFFVGGVVRDILSGQGVRKDIDVVVEGSAEQFATAIQATIGGACQTFPAFHTATLVGGTVDQVSISIDFASARTETYTSSGALPTVQLASVQEDLRRRDFTINALALPVAAVSQLSEAACSALLLACDVTLCHGHSEPGIASELKRLTEQVIDRYGGLIDLQHTVVRVLHKESFTDDPTRIFRAARYTHRVHGTLADETMQLLQECVRNGGLQQISANRIVREMELVFSEREFRAISTTLSTWGVFTSLNIPSPDAFFSRVSTLLKKPALAEVAPVLLFESWKYYCILSATDGAQGERIQSFFSIGRKKLKAVKKELFALETGADSEDVTRGMLLKAAL